jgi:hypothetical protein
MRQFGSAATPSRTPLLVVVSAGCIHHTAIWFVSPCCQSRSGVPSPLKSAARSSTIGSCVEIAADSVAVSAASSQTENVSSGSTVPSRQVGVLTLCVVAPVGITVVVAVGQTA